MITLNNIYEIRTELGLSLRELAKRSGVSYGMINMVENNKAYPSQIVILKLCHALNMPAHKVFMLDHTKVDVDSL